MRHVFPVGPAHAHVSRVVAGALVADVRREHARDESSRGVRRALRIRASAVSKGTGSRLRRIVFAGYRSEDDFTADPDFARSGRRARRDAAEGRRDRDQPKRSDHTASHHIHTRHSDAARRAHGAAPKRLSRALPPPARIRHRLSPRHRMGRDRRRRDRGDDVLVHSPFSAVLRCLPCI